MKRVKRIYVDFTSLSTYRTCGEKFRRGLLEGNQPSAESDALIFGQCIHQGLAAYHGSTSVHDTGVECNRNIQRLMAGETINSTALSECGACLGFSTFYNAAKTTHLREIVDSEMRSIFHGLRILEEYHHSYHHPRASFVPIELSNGSPALELELKHSFGKIDMLDDRPEMPELIYTGCMDGIVRDLSTNEIRGLEHKTSYILGSHFANRMKPNDQLTGYVYLLQKNGHNVDTIIANGLQTARKKIDTSPEECFARHESRRTPVDIAEWERRLTIDVRRMIEDIERNSFSSNMPDACTMWNSTCPFADVCNTHPDDRDRMLEASFRKDPWRMFKVEWAEIEA